MERNHKYKVTMQWTGNKGTGTLSYTGYGREHSILSEINLKYFAHQIQRFVEIKQNIILKNFLSLLSLPVTCCGICTCVRIMEL